MTRAELPAVVVAYGAADVPESWEPVARALAPAFRVEVPRRVAGIDPVAQLAVVIEAQPAPPIVVGHSFGGLIALLASATSARTVAGLVLVDATSSRVAASRAARAVLGSAAIGLRIAAPLARSGVGRVLLDRDLVRFVPRQRALRGALGAARYDAWRDAIGRGIADGTAAAELGAVIPMAVRAAGLAPSCAPVAVVHSRSLTRWLERPAPAMTRRALHVNDTGDRHHNIHLVHPEAVAGAVRFIAGKARSRSERAPEPDPEVAHVS